MIEFSTENDDGNERWLGMSNVADMEEEAAACTSRRPELEQWRPRCVRSTICELSLRLDGYRRLQIILPESYIGPFKVECLFLCIYQHDMNFLEGAAEARKGVAFRVFIWRNILNAYRY